MFVFPASSKLYFQKVLYRTGMYFHMIVFILKIFERKNFELFYSTCTIHLSTAVRTLLTIGDYRRIQKMKRENRKTKGRNHVI